MSKLWSESTVHFLARRDLCPRCDHPISRVGRCSYCRADLSVAVVADIVLASQAAVDALKTRQALIETLPTISASPVATRPPYVASALSVPASTRVGSPISVQSVLAAVGAALLAVAAIVFTLLNPGLTDFGTRSAIIGVTTAIFLAGAWLLARARLQFSAEAIGALGVVFVALDIWSLAHSTPVALSPFVFAGIGTLTAAVLMIAMAVGARIRSWLWLGLLGLAITPAWFGYALGTHWSVIIGHLAVGFTALAVQQILRRVVRRFRGTLAADRWTATVVELIALFVVGAELALDGDVPPGQIALALALTGLLAVLSTRNGLPRFWSAIAGALATVASVELMASVPIDNASGYAALAPIAAATALVLLSLATNIGARMTRVSRTLLLVGAVVVLMGSSLFALGIGVTAYGDVADYAGDSIPEMAAAFGLAATALGLVGLYTLASQKISRGFRFGWLVVGLCFALLSIVTLTCWVGFSPSGQVTVALCAAVALCVTARGVRAVRTASAGIRVPILVGIHLLVLHAVIVSWTAPVLSELGGVAIVLAWIAVAAVMPPKIRAVHAGIGFAYALVLFAHGLQLAHTDPIALFCVTTALASTVALVVTLVRRVPSRHWYAVLMVTAVPFVSGVVGVLFVRSGWTALSTGVTFALALTLTGTSRPGLSRVLRGVAATLLVPSLAVVVVCLGAQVLLASASPVTLPIIAVIVACTLPSTDLIGAALVRLGHSAFDARIVRLAIEASTLLTAAFAVLLALVRAAAGLPTSLIVLLILGIGAAATALVTRRRYGWIVAAASWTGALWCLWGILHVQMLEPYLLPPSIAAAIIGAIAVLRRLPGVGLYATGLGCAIVPSLLVLTGWGNGSGGPWRTIGLLAGAIGLAILGSRSARSSTTSPFGMLATPTLIGALVAASAGAVQAVRLGRGLDALWLAPHQPAMIAALELSVASAVIAAGAARRLITSERLEDGRWRWIFVPAALYLVVGPIAAVRHDWLSVLTLLVLTVAVLVIMILTAARARTRAVSLPPVWVLFAIAWCTAVAGWSERTLRVEAFSLPLGLAVLAVGILAMRGSSTESRTFTAWPNGFSGSWPLLAPGIILTVLPSIVATGTDPQTPRAILVIVLALLAILGGSLRRLGAPFVLGIAVLPIENVTVFAAQIGHTISATSWWITLATAGAVLLVIAVTSERRSGGERGVAARLRDLR